MKYLIQRLGLTKPANATPDAFELRLAKTLMRERSAINHGILFKTRLEPQEA